MESFEDSHEDTINSLFNMALRKVAFLPFGLLIDLYRWNLFDGTVPEGQWNAHWEELREKYQRIRSPAPRSEINFDAGAKFHVASGYQYINYFVSYILQFQILKSVCIAAGQYNPNNNMPLHKCDIDNSVEAGDILRKGLSLGLSKHWSDTLELMTGDRELKADAILEYFSPLQTFLKEENEKWSKLYKYVDLAILFELFMFL